MRVPRDRFFRTARAGRPGISGIDGNGRRSDSVFQRDASALGLTHSGTFGDRRTEPDLPCKIAKSMARARNVVPSRKSPVCRPMKHPAPGGNRFMSKNHHAFCHPGGVIDGIFEKIDAICPDDEGERPLYLTRSNVTLARSVSEGSKSQSLADASGYDPVLTKVSFSAARSINHNSGRSKQVSRVFGKLCWPIRKLECSHPKICSVRL